jgi:hypothetical protein
MSDVLNGETFQFWVNLGSFLSLFAVLFETLRKDLNQSIFIHSSLGLPFYFAGISQWFYFGIKLGHFVLITTCGLQLLFMFRFWPAYIRERKKS